MRTENERKKRNNFLILAGSQLSKRQGREMRACSKFTRAEKKGSEIGAINLTIKFPRETKLYPRQTYTLVHTVQRVGPSLNENEK